MSTSEELFLVVSEASGESVSASAAGSDPLASLQVEDAALYDALFGADGLLAAEADALRDQARASEALAGLAGQIGFSLLGSDTGLRTVAGVPILLAEPLISADGLTYTFIGRVDGDGDGQAEASETVALALVYQLTVEGGVVVGYTLTTLLFDVAIDHTASDLLVMNELVQLDTRLELEFSDFSKAPSGQNDYIALVPSAGVGQSGGDTSYHIVFTAGQAGTTQVNTSSTGIGVASQSTDPGELLRADFVTNVSGGNSKDLDTLGKVSHYTLSSAYFTIAQVSPTRRSVSVQIALVAEANGDWVSDAGERVAWSRWQVLDAKGNVVASGEAGQTAVLSNGKPRITVGSIGSTSTKGKLSSSSTPGSDAGALVLHGLLAGDRVVVDGIDTFNRLEVTNVGSYSFDFGAFGGSLAESGAFQLAAPAIADGTPSVSVSASSPGSLLSVSETSLGTESSESYSALFTATASGGSDGVTSQSASYSLELPSVGVNSGLVDTATGTAVVLVQKDVSTVEGRVGSSDGAVAFTVSVDGTGKVTLSQQRALRHGSTGSPTDAVLSLAAELIQLKRTETVVDGDGDEAVGSALVGIGAALNFKDDGPSISTSGTEPTLTVDETLLASDDSKSFAANFTSSFGADGAGALTYALGVVAGPSGLTDTATGEAVNLSVTDGGVVQGKTATSGLVVFEVSVAADGYVTLDQKRAVVHTNTANPDDSATLSADNLVTLTATIADKDGDRQSATLNIGQNLNFKDDGPVLASISSSQLALMKDQSVQGQINFAAGADGLGGFERSSVVLPSVFSLIDGRTVSSAVSAATASSLTITGRDNNGADFYRLVLEQSRYTFTLLQPAPFKREFLDFSSVKAGGPNERVVASGVTIDGFLYNPDQPLDPAGLTLTLASSADDLNPNSAGGIGVGNGNMDHGEGLLLETQDPVVGYSMSLTGVAGGIRDITFWWQAFDADQKLIASSSRLIGFANKVETLDISLPAHARSLYLTTTGMDANDAYRINGIERFTAAANPDYRLGFAVAGLDGDGDRSSLATFQVGLDGNGDGQLTNPLLA